MIGLIELLMNQLLKLDTIIADGDVKLQRKMQVMFHASCNLTCLFILFIVNNNFDTFEHIKHRNYNG